MSGARPAVPAPGGGAPPASAGGSPLESAEDPLNRCAATSAMSARSAMPGDTPRQRRRAGSRLDFGVRAGGCSAAVTELGARRERSGARPASRSGERGSAVRAEFSSSRRTTRRAQHRGVWRRRGRGHALKIHGSLTDVSSFRHRFHVGVRAVGPNSSGVRRVPRYAGPFAERYRRRAFCGTRPPVTRFRPTILARRRWERDAPSRCAWLP